ncbi:chalcone isomerase family protein [Necropsobacter massiliensis]|uniref:chalcone isomerase family protein n=1 Tax=Necropsobacter massiliensis TaxID=1400001 RepID=UPI0005962159|nr:chalcone isomerase family protein [Necropsobacter massiliensis]
MKLKVFLLLLAWLFSTALSAHWISVGNVDYNWGPFHVYTVSLYSETGAYQENQRPLMISFKYAKPVEGKSFAIGLVKEMNAQRFNKDSSAAWLKKMQEIFPDFSPNDVLSYIALTDRGYFILNDTVLAHEFDMQFNQALLAVWLSPQSSYAQLQNQLLGKDKPAHDDKTEQLMATPEVKQLNEEDADPQLPPDFEMQDRSKDAT